MPSSLAVPLTSYQQPLPSYLLDSETVCLFAEISMYVKPKYSNVIINKEKEHSVKNNCFFFLYQMYQKVLYILFLFSFSSLVKDI